MQISRLFQIIYLLLERKSITAGELAERFEVSVRTIYRDIDALCQAGIPIYTSQGKGGGVSLIDKFVFDKSLLSEREQDKILTALQSLSALQYPELEEVLSKLSSIFKRSNMNWIEVDFSDWGSDKRRREIFSQLKDAILEQRVITFYYFNVKGEKGYRKVEPHKLIFKHKDWYVQGYCLEKEALRTFKISRINNISITEEQCIYQNSKGYPSSIEAETEKEKIKLILKIAKEGAYRVYDDFDEENITRNEDGSYIVEVSMPQGDWIYNYLLSFGIVLEVIEPQDIREEIAKRLEHMINKYKFKT